MSKNLLGLVILGILIIGSGTIRANLLENGDFSSWVSPTQPDGWIVEDSTKAKIERCADTIHSAPYACRITRLVTGTGNNYGLKQFIPVTPGTIYTLSAWYFDDDVNARGGIVITWCREDSSAINSTTVAYTDSAIHTWQRLVKTDTAPDSAVLAKCLLRVYGFTGSPAGGVVYVDDAEFEQGSGAVTEEGTSGQRGVLLNTLSMENEKVEIKLTVDITVNGRLNVYNLIGFKCREVWRGRLVSGSYNFYWDGRDENGRRLPQGVYFVVLEGDAVKAQTRKFILNR